MTADPSWRLAYRPSTIVGGRGALVNLGTELDGQNRTRALIVCGERVGGCAPLMRSVRQALGDRIAGIFAETTPEKRLSTVVEIVARAEAVNADVLVGLGGGSSLDVARVAALVAADERGWEAIGREFEERGSISVSDRPPMPVVAIPTTLAGAELSAAAGITARPNGGLVTNIVSGGIRDRRLMPSIIVADPDVVASTPTSVLTGSAMNGFDKGIETLYSRYATPVTDGTATYGLGLLREGLPDLGSETVTAEALDPIVTGNLLVQYGASRADANTLSIIHAFGHALSRTTDIQQGLIHAILAPHVVDYIFSHVSGRRRLLATALGVADGTDPATGVVDAIRDVRDVMDLPTCLRDVDGPSPDSFPELAARTQADACLSNGPPGLDPPIEDLIGILEAAY